MKKFIAVVFAILLSAACAHSQIAGKGNKGKKTSSGVVQTDTTPPQITAGPSSAPTETSASVNWTTDELSDTQICRGVQGGPYSTCNAVIPTLVTSHSDVFTGLTASTTYYWVAKSTDNAGNTVTSSEQTFTTDAAESGGVPPYGTDSTSQILPRSYSASQPYPAASTIASVSGAANTVTIDTTAAHNLLTGDFVTVSGTGLNADIGNTSATGLSRSLGDQTVTVTAATNWPFPSGTRVFIEGSACAAVWGSFVANNVSGTTFDFESGETTALSIGAGCTVVAAAEITKVDNDTFTYARTGASGSAATGTVTPARVIPPVVGSSFTENSLLNAPQKICLFTSPSTVGDTIRVKNFHSTNSPVDAGGTLLLVYYSTGWGIFNLSNCSHVRSPGLSQVFQPSWDRTVAKKMWVRNGDTLEYFEDIEASATRTPVHDFGTSHGYSEIGMSGPTNSNEGPSTSISGRIVIIGKKSSSPECFDLLVWNIVSESVEASISVPCNARLVPDYAHPVGEADGTFHGIGVRWDRGGPDSCEFTYADPVITFNGCNGENFANSSVGEKFRTFTCSNSNMNRLWTITSKPDNNTLVASVAGLSGATSGNSCRIGTQWLGAVFFTVNGSNLEFNNNIRWVGQHGMFGVDAAGEPVWVGDTGNSPVCPVNSNGGVSHKALASNYTNGSAAYSEAKVCLTDFIGNSGGGDNSISIAANGWVAMAPRSTSTTGIGASEASLPSNWMDASRWKPFEREVIACQLVNPGQPNVCRRLAHLYFRETGSATDSVYGAFTLDGSKYIYNCNWRMAGVTDNPAVCIIDLGVW